MPIFGLQGKLYIRMPAHVLIDFTYWFFVSVPLSIIGATKTTVLAICHFFSLEINVRTLFQPWKNERRKGYVGIARGLGFFVKSFTIVVNIGFIILVLFLSLGLIAVWFFTPIFILLF